MIRDGNFFKTSTTCFALIAIWVAACHPLPTAVVSPDSTPIVIRTVMPSSRLAEILTLTPDIWKIEKCHGASSIVRENHNMIWNYTGNIESGGRVDMLLNFTKNNEIKGLFFDFEQMREYQVSGCVEGRSFTMWLQQENVIDTIIKGEFPESDPRGYYSGTLSIDVITGALVTKSNPKNPGVYLRLVGGNGGTMERRFELAGVQDDMVILNACRKFLNAVTNDERAQVVDMLSFPVKVWLGGDEKELQTTEIFLSYYDAIFGNGFKERLAITFPDYLVAYSGNSGGVSLLVYGGGSVIFNRQGKVTALYNWKE